jgi:hypothetical protein
VFRYYAAYTIVTASYRCTPGYAQQLYFNYAFFYTKRKRVKSNEICARDCNENPMPAFAMQRMVGIDCSEKPVRAPKKIKKGLF